MDGSDMPKSIKIGFLFNGKQLGPVNFNGTGFKTVQVHSQDVKAVGEATCVRLVPRRGAATDAMGRKGAGKLWSWMVVSAFSFQPIGFNQLKWTFLFSIQQMGWWSLAYFSGGGYTTNQGGVTWKTPAQKWPPPMGDLLTDATEQTIASGGCLPMMPFGQRKLGVAWRRAICLLHLWKQSSETRDEGFPCLTSLRLGWLGVERLGRPCLVVSMAREWTASKAPDCWFKINIALSLSSENRAPFFGNALIWFVDILWYSYK
jgi:hypothetical protein